MRFPSESRESYLAVIPLIKFIIQHEHVSKIDTIMSKIDTWTIDVASCVSARPGKLDKKPLPAKKSPGTCVLSPVPDTRKWVDDPTLAFDFIRIFSIFYYLYN